MSIPFLFISGAEMAFIVFILVMVFGADKIPEIARGLGKGIRGIRNATNEIKGEVFKSGNAQSQEVQKIQEDIKSQVTHVKEEIKEITTSVSKK